MHVNNVEAHKVVSLIGREPSICAKNLSIDFPIYDVHSRSLKHTLMFKPITNVMRGAPQVGGAIAAGARNGGRARHRQYFVRYQKRLAGRADRPQWSRQTALLRSIAGIYEPTDGNLDTTGRIMPLFNMMEGMMPEATGREFIRIRGILLGLDPGRTEALAEEVIDFCELGAYIDMPVRTYSTGMLVRLAFALATSVTSEILLFDELIGAGDERFVSKAQQRLQAFVERSSIIVVATHSRAVLDQWCNRAFLLEQGSLVHDGSVQQVLQDYDRRQAVKGG
jgi:ABC-type polysaccharide/polyol phosphate transport system ATPase subunit